MREWDAEIEVDETLARRLIRDSYPELHTESLRMLGIGWDNTVWACSRRTSPCSPTAICTFGMLWSTEPAA